jgi:flagellar biosynthesis chaperone FliJ
MSRFCALILVLALTLVTNACFETTLGNLTGSAPSPSSTRLSEINGQLSSIQQQLNQLQNDRDIYEAARNEAFMELSKLTGMGPKAPSMSDFMSETLTSDPGQMIAMHNANLTIAREKMQEVDAQMAQLSQQAAGLRAERTKIEQSIAQSSKSGFGKDGACFTPDTQVRLPEGTKSIAALSAGEPVLVYDELRGEITQRRILKTFRGREDHYFLVNGDVRVTALHRFMTETGWVRAKDLELGTKLKTAEGWTTLTSKNLIDADIEVFNMEVDEHHDFFIAGANGSYLVHNTGGGGK